MAWAPAGRPELLDAAITAHPVLVSVPSATPHRRPVSRPAYAGESVGSVTGERLAADVVRELTAGAEQALRDVRDLLV
jgi:hypothetical protein